MKFLKNLLCVACLYTVRTALNLQPKLLIPNYPKKQVKDLGPIILSLDIDKLRENPSLINVEIIDRSVGITPSTPLEYLIKKHYQLKDNKNYFIALETLLTNPQSSIREERYLDIVFLNKLYVALEDIIKNDQVTLITLASKKLIKSKPFFESLNGYPIYEIISDLMPNNKIDKDTAINFLKIDQKNPPKDFKDKNLELIQKGYLFAKEHNLKKIGAFILNYMKALAGTLRGGPEEVIASFTRQSGPVEKHVSLKESVKTLKQTK